MASKWTVTPETVKVEGEWNGEAFWLELKKDLTEGERRRVMTAGWKGVSGTASDKPSRVGEAPKSAEITIDWSAQSIVRTLTFLVDWSLADDKGNKLPITRDTVEALYPAMYEAIEGAINKHVEGREQEKKAPAGKLRPKAISA